MLKLNGLSFLSMSVIILLKINKQYLNGYKKYFMDHTGNSFSVVKTDIKVSLLKYFENLSKLSKLLIHLLPN